MNISLFFSKKILFCCTLISVSLLLSGCSLFSTNQQQAEENVQAVVQEEVQEEPNEEKIVDYRILEENHTYTQQDLPFTRVHNKIDFPFPGGAMIDIDSDWLEEVFITSESGKNDALLAYRNWQFVDIISETQIANTQASYGALAIDIDKDADTDLFVARKEGVYTYINNNGLFEEKKLDVTFPDDTTPVDITPWDIDNDWDIDLYISTFISAEKIKLVTFNDTNNKKPNLLLINQGDGLFVDETDRRWITYVQNTFTAIFVDLDKNWWLDLVTSPNTDKIEIWMNDNWQFTSVDSPTQYGFWMGMTANDFDQDWDIDIYASNTWKTIAPKFLKGDTMPNQTVVPEFAYLLNDGTWTLTQSISAMNPAENGFAWWVISADINWDTKLDLLITQNNIKRPPHKLKKLSGEALVFLENNTYEDQIVALWLENKAYGFSLLQWDVDGNGLADIIYLNFNSPSRVALHNSDNKNTLFHLPMPTDLSTYWSRVELSFPDWTTLSQYFLPKQWVLTSQSFTMSFIMGNQKKWVLSIYDWSGILLETKNIEVE